MTQKHKVHQSSKCLSGDENGRLFQLIPEGSQTLATAVVQVLLAEDTQSGPQWRIYSFGVACLLKNNLYQSFFITIFDIVNGTTLFDQEFYLELDYQQRNSFFHSFEGEACVVGLNFTDETEADEFYVLVQDKLRVLRKKHGFTGSLNSSNFLEAAEISRRNSGISSGSSKALNEGDKNSRPSSGISEREQQITKPGNHQREGRNFNFLAGAQGVQAPLTSSPVSTPTKKHEHQTTTPKPKESKGKKAAKEKKPRLNITDIGAPIRESFQHISHIGWDRNKGFQYDESDPTIAELFQLAGIDIQGKDAEEKEFIYGYIENNLGGLKSVRAAASEKIPDHVSIRANMVPSPRTASRAPPGRPSKPAPVPPPVLPSHSGQNGNPPSRHHPEDPPQRPRQVQAPPPPARGSSWPDEPFSPPPSFAPPPPPPPPPPPLVCPPCFAPPPPPPMPVPIQTAAIRQADDSRGALLSDIRNRPQLRPIEQDEAPPVATSGHDQLMLQIKSRQVSLKPVTVTAAAGKELAPVLDGMAAALARALAARRGVIEVDEVQEADDVASEEEWSA